MGIAVRIELLPVQFQRELNLTGCPLKQQRCARGHDGSGGRVTDLSRARCREVFETRFTATRMADDYMEVYEQMVHRTAEEYAELAAS